MLMAIMLTLMFQLKIQPKILKKAILDKLGKNEVKLEKDGFTSKRGKWITYEEVTDEPRTYTL